MVKKKSRTNKIIKILKATYPEVKTQLHYRNPFELLVATILSAQCTDERVNKVTQHLFKKYRSAKDYARVDLPELEEDTRPTGFFRNKAKSIKAFCALLDGQYNGEVPASLEELVSLPGIGRKTANLVLSEAFDIPGMIAVAVACLPIFFTGGVIARWEGLLFFGYYLAYTIYLLLSATHHDTLPIFNTVMLLFVIPLTTITLIVSFFKAVRVNGHQAENASH